MAALAKADLAARSLLQHSRAAARRGWADEEPQLPRGGRQSQFYGEDAGGFGGGFGQGRFGGGFDEDRRAVRGGGGGGFPSEPDFGPGGFESADDFEFGFRRQPESNRPRQQQQQQPLRREFEVEDYPRYNYQRPEPEPARERVRMRRFHVNNSLV